MYFRLGGSSIKGVSKPGHIVWSRIFVADDRLHCDLGLGEVITLPAEETEDRWKQTTEQWPIMHAVLMGVTRDQMMARHKESHPGGVRAGRSGARKAMFAKAAAMRELGLKVHFCGVGK
jgi:hypothetical protein